MIRLSLPVFSLRLSTCFAIAFLFVADAGAQLTIKPVVTGPIKVDYAGRPVVTQMVPRLTFEAKRAPSSKGIDYPFAEQTAFGIARFERFPTFSLSDRRIHLSGPWYDSELANTQFPRGITSIEAIPANRVGPTDIRKLPYSQKRQVISDQMLWDYAARLVTELTAKNPADPRISLLRIFATDHKYVQNGRDSFLELGRRIWLAERATTDAKQQGVMYISIEVATTRRPEWQRECVGAIYEGMVEVATKAGVTLVPITSGQATAAHGPFYQSVRLEEKGDPAYLLPENDFFAASDNTLKVCDAMRGVVSMDFYNHAIWGEEPFLMRESDGTPIVTGDSLRYNPIKVTKAYGNNIPLEQGEAERCLSEIYEQAQRMYLMHHHLAGQYPANSNLRKDFLKNVRVGAWTRFTNEQGGGIVSEGRPITPWMMEMLAGMYLFTADDLVVQGAEMPLSTPGADNSKIFRFNAHSVVEYVMKAAHRYSVLDTIHKGPFQWCWFRLPIVDRNKPDGERYYQKPIVFAKIRVINNQPWLELFATWPALDQQPASFKLWLDKDGKKSSAYTIDLANGRSYFYDAWQLPAGFSNIEGKNVWLRFKDQAGTMRTWRGEWREAVDDSVPTPADFNGM